VTGFEPPPDRQHGVLGHAQARTQRVVGHLGVALEVRLDHCPLLLPVQGRTTMGIDGQDELEFLSLAAEMPDFPWAGDTLLATDGFPFPAVEQVAFVVPDRRGFHTVMADRGTHGRSTGGWMGGEELVLRAAQGRGRFALIATGLVWLAFHGGSWMLPEPEPWRG
jgi:hypothetical protein